MMTTFFAISSMASGGLFPVVLFAALCARSNDLGSIAMWLAVASGTLGAAASLTYLFGA